MKPLVRFSESFTSVAKSKLEFLQGQGGRVVALVLEDRHGQCAMIDRWGKVTWTRPTNRELERKKPETEPVKPRRMQANPAYHFGHHGSLVHGVEHDETPWCKAVPACQPVAPQPNDADHGRPDDRADP